MSPAPSNVTQLLLEWRRGNQQALDRLMPLVYDELRRLAQHYMRSERPEHTLQATALVNEAYIRLVDMKVSWQDRESLVKTALEYLNSLAQEAGADPALQRELALAYQRVGDVQVNPTNANLGDTAAALTSYRKALAIAKALVAAHPTDADAQRTLALIHQRLGDLQAWTGDLTGAVDSVRKSRPSSRHWLRLMARI